MRPSSAAIFDSFSSSWSILGPELMGCRSSHFLAHFSTMSALRLLLPTTILFSAMHIFNWSTRNILKSGLGNIFMKSLGSGGLVESKVREPAGRTLIGRLNMGLGLASLSLFWAACATAFAEGILPLLMTSMSSLHRPSVPFEPTVLGEASISGV